MGFDTPITLTGPLRAPKQMLDEQLYDGHTSVHDEATAAKLGLAGAPIEGPTHFSQFDPLAVAAWGDAWFERGCISAHFQTMVVEGEEVRATLTTAAARPSATSAASATIAAHKADGTPVLTGTASIGPDHPPSELDRRLATFGDPGELFVVDRLHVGMTGGGGTVSITHTDRNGDLYPFSLAQKLEHITEPHPWYTPDGAATSPWGAAVLPFEMASVLAHKVPIHFPVRTPSVGLFLDLEVRMLAGPLLVGREYTAAHEVVGLGQSRKTESYWTRTTLTDTATGVDVATVLLHSGVFKASYPGYPADRLAG